MAFLDADSYQVIDEYIWKTFNESRSHVDASHAVFRAI